MSATSPGGELNPRARGWLRFLWQKATTPDDWSSGGEPHPWWDRYSSEPVMNFARFDLSESAYAVGVMASLTPAWREVYGTILGELARRHLTYWAAIDWLTQLGPDPRRGAYPREWIDTYIPKHLVGQYDTPGWVANGVAPWGLQPDPIGADGNLFFKGWLNLLLTLEAHVIGHDRRTTPFQVAGVGGTSFEWTHHRLTEWLVELWKRHPAGPHCENTKVWPYCLNAAGLGLSLYDRLYGTDRHQAWAAWHAATQRDYFGIEGGKLKWVTLYYDPLAEHKQTIGPSGGFANALYLMPQDPALAELLYHGATTRMGWNDPAQAVRPTADPRFVALGRVLAKEFGDDVTSRRLGLYAEEHYEPRFFGTGEDDFGWWFRLNEPWPRGQLSALMMMAEVGGSGAWNRLFSAPNQGKHWEPTVEGVSFPTLGVDRAWNDLTAGVLHLRTYAADSSRRAQPTSFRVTRLADPASAHVRCDEEEHLRWRVSGENEITIDSDIGPHRFEVLGRSPERNADSRPAAVGRADLSVPAREARSPGRAVTTRSTSRAMGPATLGGLACPCC
ncbi:MAG: hypothetical protein ACKVZ0_10285 [Gemmatimonadales bacterium]